MDNVIKTKLDEEIEKQIEGLSDVSGKSRTEAIDDLVKLHKLRIDEVRLETESEEKAERRKLDERKVDNEIESQINDCTFKRNQEREDHKNRYLRFGIDAAGIVLPLVFYGVWMRKGFKFEEHGTFTSTTFRGLFNRFKPTNKG